MILVDGNLLVHGHVKGMRQRRRARAWLEEQLNEAPRVGLPWSSLAAFLRIVTNPRVFERPEPLDAAWRQVTEWLGLAPARVPLPTESHAEILARLLPHTGGSSALVADAHLASIAIGHGLELSSADSDFARFPELRWQNPLA